MSAACLAYPFVANYLQEQNASAVIDTYEEESKSLKEEEKAQMLSDAQEYNNSLSAGTAQLTDPFKEEEAADTSEERYYSLLNADGSGVMCYVDIPKIDVYLPVYHGTGAEVMEKGAGHLIGSSLPVGGEGTHSIISAHTGLNTAKMFTDLTAMEEGDLFYLHTLGDVLAYQVDQISVVLPTDISKLGTVAGEDYCTLVTCTPYGVNTHRLLVRGTRVDYDPGVAQNEAEKAISTPVESQWMREYTKALSGGIGIVVGVILCVFVFRRMSNTTVKSRKCGGKKKKKKPGKKKSR